MPNNIIYKKATVDDLKELVLNRLLVLRTVFNLDEDTDMSAVESATQEYYANVLSNGSHTAYLVYAAGKVIGVGDICYYQVMPMSYDPSGMRAYIMNMYTAPEHRSNGIAVNVVNLLLEDAKSRGITVISLSSTEMGKAVYKKCGFVFEDGAMIYKGV